MTAPSTPSAPAPYDGRHLIADLHGCVARLDDASAIDRMLRAAAAAAGATVIGMHLHHFGPGQGVTGVVILAESHISIHTWPEHAYAAVDIFMCGRSHQIDAALEVISEALQPDMMEESALERGFGVAAKA